MNTLRLSVVIPIRDEADNIEPLAREIESALRDIEWECLWVDDASRDGSPERLRALRLRDPRHRILEFSEPRGQTAALLAGFRAARGVFVAGMDGDGQNDPLDLPPLLSAAEAQSLDMVNGVRAVRHDSRIRRISSRIANGFRNWITGDHITDVGCAIRVIRREFAAGIPAFRGLHRFLPTLVRLQGGRIAEMPVRHRPRTAGRTKYGINNRLWAGLVDTFGVRWMTRRAIDVGAREIEDVASEPVVMTTRPSPAGVPRAGAAAMRATALPRWAGPAFAAGLLLLAFGFQGTRGLWEPDEGRYAEVAREMLVTGDFLVPRLNFQPHFTKPPLTYWSIALSMAAFGRSEWAVRFYLALAYMGTVLLVVALGSRLWDRRAGFTAGAIYATSFLPFAAASVATPDTLLVFWETLGLYALWRGWTAVTSRERILWPAVTGAAFGLAFLTKGPPGLLFLPAAWIFRAIVRRGEKRPAAISPAGWLAFAALGLGWYAAAILREPPLLDYLLKHEVAGRLAGEHHRNAEWYGALAIYGPAFLLGFLPWNLTVPKLWRRAFPVGLSRAEFRRFQERPEALFLLLSFAVPLLIFVVARSRLVFYVLPLFVPLSLAVARTLTAPGGVMETTAAPDLSRRLRLLPALAGLLLAVRLAFALWPSDHDARRLYRLLPPSGEGEIVSLDSRPHYGLAFYSGWRVDQATWSHAGPDESGQTSIDAELREETEPGHERHLFLMPSRDEPRFLESLARIGRTAPPHRDLGNLSAFLTPGDRG